MQSERPLDEQTLVALFDKGNLQSVTYLYVDDDPALSGIELGFDDGVLLLTVNPDSDTIVCAASPGSGVRVDVSNKEHWRLAVGLPCAWAWSMTNQFGYTDGIQFAFNPEQGDDVGFQLVAMASHLDVSQVNRMPAGLDGRLHGSLNQLADNSPRPTT